MSDKLKLGERVRVTLDGGSSRAGEMGTVLGLCEALPEHVLVLCDGALNRNVFHPSELLRSMEIEGVVETFFVGFARTARVVNANGEELLPEVLLGMANQRVRVTIEQLPNG